MLILTGLSGCHKFQLHFVSLVPQIKGTFIKIERFKNEAMLIWKEDNKSSYEQYTLILLSHIVMYWIWFSLDSGESLAVIRFSPPVFGLQHCCVCRKRMKLNMGGLRLNNLFLYFLFHHLYLFFLFFFFNFPSFCSLYFFSFYSFFFYFLLQPMLILTGLSGCHKFQLHFVSLMPQIKGTFIKIERFKNEAMPIWKEDNKSSWEQYTLILFSHIVTYWIWFSLDSGESLAVIRFSPPVFGLQHCCVFRKRMKLNMGGLRLNNLFLYFLFHHLYLFFLFFFFNFPSFCSLYFFSFYSFFFYFLLQPMLILTGLSWCHKFQLHFMSLMPQIKGTFFTIERFKNEAMAISKEDDKSSWEQYHIILLYTLSCTEFDPCLSRMKACS